MELTCVRTDEAKIIERSPVWEANSRSAGWRFLHFMESEGLDCINLG